jgi:hypothetical protein
MGYLAVIVIVPRVDMNKVWTHFGDKILGDSLREDVLILVTSGDAKGISFVFLQFTVR